MDNASILKKLNITNEEEILKEIRTLNQKNREERAVLNSTIAQTSNQIKSLLMSNPKYQDLIDVDRLNDLNYVNETFNKFMLIFEQNKIEFNNKANEALRLLKSI